MVALRKESVDRNIRHSVQGSFQRVVALRKESVDRNTAAPVHEIGQEQSLSARRAWIEIIERIDYNKDYCVALRKESVDRNTRSTAPSV